MATAQCCNDVTKFKLPCILAYRTNCLVQNKTAISLFQPTLLSNLAWHGFVKWSLAGHLAFWEMLKIVHSRKQKPGFNSNNVAAFSEA